MLSSYFINVLKKLGNAHKNVLFFEGCAHKMLALLLHWILRCPLLLAFLSPFFFLGLIALEGASD